MRGHSADLPLDRHHVCTSHRGYVMKIGFEPDRQSITIKIDRYADDDGSWYTIYDVVNASEPLGDGPDLDTALHNTQLQSIFLDDACWVG